MEYHDQYHDQRSPGPDKKDNKGPKGKESKPPQAKTKKIKGISNLPHLSYPRRKKRNNVTKKNPWLNDAKKWKEGYKTMTKYM